MTETLQGRSVPQKSKIFFHKGGILLVTESPLLSRMDRSTKAERLAQDAHRPESSCSPKSIPQTWLPSTTPLQTRGGPHVMQKGEVVIQDIHTVMPSAHVRYCC